MTFKGLGTFQMVSEHSLQVTSSIATNKRVSLSMEVLKSGIDFSLLAMKVLGASKRRHWETAFLFYYVIKRKKRRFFFLIRIRPKEFLACVMNSFTETSTYFRTKLSKNNLLHRPGTFFSLLPRIQLMHIFPGNFLWLLYLILFCKEDSYAQVGVSPVTL